MNIIIIIVAIIIIIIVIIIISWLFFQREVKEMMEKIGA